MKYDILNVQCKCTENKKESNSMTELKRRFLENLEGKPVLVQQGSRQIEGELKALDDEGNLIILYDRKREVLVTGSYCIKSMSNPYC